MVKEDGFIPTKDFYLKNSRSCELREICIEAIRNLDLKDKSNNDNFFSDEACKILIHLRFERIYQKLLELGIANGIHDGNDLEFFQSSPVNSAEWLAGKIFQLIDKKEDLLETSRFGKPTTNLRKAESESKKFLAQKMIREIIVTLFAVTPDELE